MAKVNASKVKAVASKGGVRVPPSPVKVQKPDQLKKQAQARAKARMKSLMKILIFIAIAAIIGLVVYLVKFHGRMPKDAFNNAVEYAYKSKTVQFRDMFTSDSIALVESGEGNAEDSWNHLMSGITPQTPPKVTREKQEDKKGIKTATLDVMIDGEMRTVHMLQEDGSWKINLNVALNPQKLTLPDDIPPEYIQNFEISDEDEAWWEDSDEDEENSKTSKKSGGFLSKLNPFKKGK